MASHLRLVHDATEKGPARATATAITLPSIKELAAQSQERFVQVTLALRALGWPPRQLAKRKAIQVLENELRAQMVALNADLRRMQRRRAQ